MSDPMTIQEAIAAREASLAQKIGQVPGAVATTGDKAPSPDPDAGHTQTMLIGAAMVLATAGAVWWLVTKAG